MRLTVPVSVTGFAESKIAENEWCAAADAEPSSDARLKIKARRRCMALLPDGRVSILLVALEVVFAERTTDVRPTILLPVVDHADLTQVRLELRHMAHLRKLWKPGVNQQGGLLFDRSARRLESELLVAKIACPEPNVEPAI